MSSPTSSTPMPEIQTKLKITPPTAETPVDIWRDTPLRYLGYANELGESFRPVVPSLVLPSYAVAIGYCLADTYHKTSAAHDTHLENTSLIENQIEKKSTTIANTSLFTLPISVPATVAHAFIDTLLWQGLASVALPGLVINRTVWAVSRGMSVGAVRSALPPTVIKWAPTLIGLSIIPLIVHPIDEFVHDVMDKTTRKVAKSMTESTDSPAAPSATAET